MIEEIYQGLIVESYGIPVVLILFFLLQIYYPLFLHRKVGVNEPDDYDIDIENLEPVSVVIAARNECENLKTFLPAILAQDHPNFEVIVVNDRSTDESEFLLKELGAKNPHLAIVTIVDSYKFKYSKKYAMTMGIKKAKHETLIFTDADCMPDTVFWLRGMQSAYQKNTEIVLGYSPYEKKGGLLNKFIRFETVITALNYFSYAFKGKAYMGVGRNLSYKRSLFFNNKGFASHMHVLSGDDDLFVNETATSENVVVQLHSATFMTSIPKTTFSGYIKQKFRHFGASSLYKASHKRILSWQILVQLIFHVLWIAALFFSIYSVYIAAGVLFLNYIIKMICYRFCFRRLHAADLMIWFPFLDFSHTVFIFFFGIIGQFKSSKSLTWK